MGNSDTKPSSLPITPAPVVVTEPPKKKICCACPDTKKLRDPCIAERVMIMDVKSLGDVKGSGLAVIHFWAAWSEPCKVMDTVMAALAKEHAGAVSFQRVEAEEVDDVVEKFGIESVPAFVFLRDGVVVDRLDGADAPSLTAKTSALASGGAHAGAAAPAAASAATPGGAVDVIGRIKYILASHPVCLFMKGVATAPRCGFSGRVVEALQAIGAPFHCVDILADEALRTGLKEYSNWPTYPQLYVKSELVGGCDIIMEMAGSGELKALIVDKLGPDFGGAAAAAAPAAPAAPAAVAAPAAGDNVWVEGKEHLNGRIKRLLDSQPIMLFMKGNPDAPRCGFSRKVVDALSSNGLEFGTFDILGDEGVRNGLKEYSNWPTYPQLYVKGELVGGCDIVLEMNESGELKSSVQEMLGINPDK
ncbi:hypothetical protein FOA52_009980 [Chlamydomonas sp. UWO 241]|nr:hypothetical protein FOA52_009980 [Chlamydomonas sp. UWO 241]